VTEPVHVIRKLEQALADDDFAWSLLLVGEDQTDKLATLTGDLRGPFSSRSPPASPTGASARPSPGRTPPTTPSTW